MELSNAIAHDFVDKFLFVYIKGMQVPVKGWFIRLETLDNILIVKDDRGFGYVNCGDIICLEVMTKEEVEKLQKDVEERREKAMAQRSSNLVLPGGK